MALAPRQESTNYRARPIDSFAEEAPILTPAQLRLIAEFSEYYFVTQPSIARIMVPDKPERTGRPKPRQLPDIRFSVSPRQIPKLKEAAQSFPNNGIIRIQDVSSFVWLVLHLAKQHAQSQILVLVPTIEMLEAIGASIIKAHPKNVAAIHSRLSKTEYWNQYKRVLSGEACIILSTRQGVFLPIQNNSHIIFFDSTSQDFKQDEQHPRYDSRIAALWLARHTQSKLLYASSSETIRRVSSPVPELPSARTAGVRVSLVDMKNEMQRKDFSIVAGLSLESIKGCLKRGKKIVVIALREESEKGVSVNAVFDILTTELKSCKVSKDLNDFDVLIGTPQALEGLKLSQERGKLGLLVFASIEPLLAISDYRSAERAYYRLMHWRMLARELGFERVMLQSYTPELAAVRAFAYGEFDAFKKQELKNRKELNYPPYSKLIKLSYRGKDAEKDVKAASTLLGGGDAYNKSNAAAKERPRRSHIMGPFTGADKKQSFIIKLSEGVATPRLASLGPDWSIDRDPENIL